MSQYKILYFHEGVSAFCEHLRASFELIQAKTLEQCFTQVTEDTYKAVVVDCSDAEVPDFDSCEALINEGALDGVPLILLSPSTQLQDKLKAYELGCDDVIEAGATPEEAGARINKSVYHRIANEQLNSRLKDASETAYAAMSDNSDLGANIQFLLDVNHCDNFDELGLLFFNSVQRYGVSCSLQMRSIYETKNMDATGMERDLESQLLLQMKDGGRYIDFGRRTVFNYGQVSLLIRNMPVDDEKKYGAVKDNTFSLLQGIDARIKALDSKQTLINEKQSLLKLSSDVHGVMKEIDDSYQDVMKEIVSGVEDIAESIQDRIPVLALSEEQEKFFEQVVHNMVKNTNDVFNQGLKVDECFTQLSENIEKALSRTDRLNEQAMSAEEPKQSVSSSSDIDLF